MMQQPDAYVGQNPAEVLARDFCRIFTRLQRQRNVHNMEYITHTDQTLSARLAASERILIGIGPEWGLKSEKENPGLQAFRPGAGRDKGRL